MSDRLASRACEIVRAETTAKLAAEVAAPRAVAPAVRISTSLSVTGASLAAEAAALMYRAPAREFHRATAIREARKLARVLLDAADELEAEGHA